MARIRNIKPEFWDDEDLARACCRDARLLFIGLWNQADKAGRLENRPARLKVRLFPYDKDVTDTSIADWLDELERGKFIVRYEMAGKALIQIRTFIKHQHLSKHEAESSLPAPSLSHTSIAPVLDEHLTSTQDIGLRTKDIGQGKEDSASTPAEDAWEDWRDAWHQNPKRRQLPLALSSLDFQKVLEVATRFTDRPHRRALMGAYFSTQNKQILKNPFTVGWFLHWADKLAQQLLADDEQADKEREFLAS